MKRWIVMIWGVGFLWAYSSYQIKLLEDRGDVIRVEFILSQYKIENVEINGITCSKVEVPDHLVTFLIKGLPELPKFASSVIIPDEGVMDYRIVEVNYETEKVNPIVPSKGNLKRNINPEDVPYEFSDFYKRDEWFPQTNVEISKPFILREFRGLTINFYPFQYNPLKGKLKIARKIVVEIYKKRGGGENILIRKRNTITRPFIEIYKNFFLNYKETRTRYPFLKDTLGNMLIITADAYYDNLQPFVFWKKKMGIPVEIESVSNIGNNPTSIKNYIQDKYNTEGVTWVLLVGNANDVATIASPEGYDETCDPVYGFLAGNDRYFDAFISRFSANNETHVDLQVAKVIKYERYPPQGSTWDWYHKGIGTASSEGDPQDSTRMNWLIDTLLAYTYTEVTKVYEPWGTDQMITNALNEGRSLLNHIGHGNETGFGTATAFWFDINDIAALSNTDMLPFVFLVACLTGDFDAVPTCCCEQWMWTGTVNDQRGAIGAYGASVLQSWVPPTVAQLHAMGLLKREEATTIGGICFNGSMYMYEQTGDLEMLETWHIFGDASVDLRTDIPDTFSVTHDPFVTPAPTSFTVQVKDKDGVTPIEKALVCLWIYTQTPELHVAGYTDANGEITFNITPQNVGDTMWITVTKHNYAPYEGYAIVQDVGMPEVPTIIKPLDFAKLPDLNPTLSFYSNDPQNDGIEYKIIWDTDPNFTSPESLITPVYPSGQIVNFNFPYNLSQGETYWWKVKCRDPQGSGYWTQYTQKRSFTIDTTLPSNTCSWYQTTAAQFNYNTFNGTMIEGDSVILVPQGQTVVETLLFENFESGIPSTWTVIDGNNDNYKWTSGTTGDLGSYEPPNYGTAYAYYSDDDAGNGTINYNEELISPSIGIPQNAENLELVYGYGFRVWETGEKFIVHIRKKTGGSWTNWTAIKTYTASGSGTETIDLTNQLPCDSIQIRFFYSDSTSSSHWGWACATDNVTLRYSYSLSNNFGTMTGTPVLFSELSKTYSRDNWGYIYFYKATPNDSIGIQVEYYDGANWQLVPDAILPGNSQGIFSDSQIGKIDIRNLDTLTYHTLRIKSLFYRVVLRTPDNPALLAWEVGNPGPVEVSESGNRTFTPYLKAANIFRDKLILKYAIPINIKGTLKIYDPQGRLVKDLSAFLKSGENAVYWKDKTSSGVYFVKFKAGDYRKTLKIVKIK